MFSSSINISFEEENKSASLDEEERKDAEIEYDQNLLQADSAYSCGEYLEAIEMYE